MKNLYPSLLAFIQLTSLVVILISGPKLAQSVFGLITEFIGIFLGVYAIYIMKPGNFNIRPIVKNNGKLVTSGPYKFIRHPMYTAQIIATIPLVVESFTYFRLIILSILIVVLIVKIFYEEKKLINHFDDYTNYMKTTKRLIPFVF